MSTETNPSAQDKRNCYRPYFFSQEDAEQKMIISNTEEKKFKIAYSEILENSSLKDKLFIKGEIVLYKID